VRRITRSLEHPQERRPIGQLQTGVILQDRYLILEVVGTGGMGSVYRARDLHFPNVTKVVAVKEVVSSASDPTMQKMIVHNFEREANLLATLSHPAIPRIFDYFTKAQNAYLVMDYIEGINLEAYLRSIEGFPSEEQVISWAIGVCDVLSYLHAHQPQPVIFRDIKPSNIMIDDQQNIHLIDFGIARLFQPGERGTMIGTEGYSPPEQYRGEASPSGDIYALGATMHHLLTKHDPRSEAPFSFAERPIHTINPSVSAELEAIIERALRYEPADRFSTASEMMQALLAVAKHPTAQPARAHVSVETHSEVKELWTFECEDEIRGSPIVHRGILYTGCYDHNLYAHDAKSGRFLWKYATDGGIASRPAAYEDTIFITSEDQRLHAITFDTGKLLWTYYSEGPIRSSPVVYEGHLFFGSDDGNLHVVNMLSGRRAWKAEAAGPIRSTPVISEDGVLFGSESGHLYCTDFRGEPRWRFRSKRAITGSPLVVDKIIYVGSTDGMLYALAAEAGWELWRFRLGKPTISTPAFENGMVFTGCTNGGIYAIDAKSNREVWRFETQHQVTASPFIHEDTLLCGSVDGALYCLDHRTGREHWRFKTQGPITGAVAYFDGTLYFGSTDHCIYALLA
jgi:serine/threonine protein kinase